MAFPFGAVASVLGGLLGRSKTKTVSSYQNTFEAMHAMARGARTIGKKYKFNPLTLLGAASPVGASSTTSENYLGSAIADAGLLLEQNQVSKEQELGRISELEKQNAKLREKLLSETIRPTVGGIYSPGGAANVRYGTVAEGVGMPAVDEYGGIIGGAKALEFGDKLAPGYQANQTPVEQTSGLFSIRNGFTGGHDIWMPGQDGEVTDIGELPVMLAFGAPQMAYHAYMDKIGRPFGQFVDKALSFPFDEGAYRSRRERYQASARAGGFGFGDPLGVYP